MRILFIGDIVGRPGVRCVQELVPKLRAERQIDAVVANAENAAGGSGCTPGLYRQIREAGVDLVTLGDHIFKKSDIVDVLNRDDRICKPANYPTNAPGREFAEIALGDGRVLAVVSLLGRTFMRSVDCPFQAIDRVLAHMKDRAAAILVDMHAEATADKYLIAHHLDGRVAAVLGTHTHVQTADEQILPRGTAFVCDVGMTGPYASILGRKIDPVLRHATTFLPAPFEVADGDVRLGGAIVDVDTATGLATHVERLMVRSAEA